MIENLDVYNFKEHDQEDDREIISDLKNSEQKKLIPSIFMMKRVPDYLIRFQNLKSIIQLEQNWKLLKSKNTLLKTTYLKCFNHRVWKWLKQKIKNS